MSRVRVTRQRRVPTRRAPWPKHCTSPMPSKASSPLAHPSPPPPISHNTYRRRPATSSPPSPNSCPSCRPHSANEVPPPIPFPPTPPSTLLWCLQPRRNPGTILQAPSSCRRGCIQPIPNPARTPRRCHDGPPTLSCSPATAPTPQRRSFRPCLLYTSPSPRD